MLNNDKFYPEVVNVTIDLDNNVIVSETNLLKYGSSRVSLEGLNDDEIDNKIQETIDLWFSMDTSNNIFTEAVNVEMARHDMILTLTVCNYKSSIMFEVDYSTNNIKLEFKHGVRHITIIDYNTKYANDLITSIMPLYIESLIKKS